MQSNSTSLEPSEMLRLTLSSAIQLAFHHSVTTLRATPPDKLDYRPSPTANSIRELGSQIGASVGLCMMTLGLEMPEGDGSSMDAVIAGIESAGADLVEFINSLEPRDMDFQVDFMGVSTDLPRFLCTCETNMTRHASQIDYIQTIWGDRDNHF